MFHVASKFLIDLGNFLKVFELKKKSDCATKNPDN